MNNKLPLIQSILDGTPSAELDTLFPFYPLNSPGMPLPGPNFCRQAVAMGEGPTITGTGKQTRLEDAGKYLHYLYRRALYDRRFSLPMQHKGMWFQADYLTGHPMNAAGGPQRDDEETENAFGPRPAEVMVVGKHPGREEFQQLRNFCGPASDDLYKAFADLGLMEADYGDWYVTNAMRFQQLDPNGGSVAADWLKDCAPLLHQELRIVRPKYLLCFGAEAIKAVLGTGATVSSIAGRAMTLTYPIHRPGETPEMHTVQVMGMLHPAAVFHRPELYDEFVQYLGLFWQMINGVDVGAVEPDIDHRAVYKERELATLVDQMLADTDPDSDIIAVDGEWHGDHPSEPGSYLRTIQISNKDKWARCIVLRHAGGESAFKPGIDRAIFHLNRLFNPVDRPRPRVGGHFFRADLPWLLKEGLDLREHYEPHPTDVKGGGWDTGLMYHAVNEATRYKLEDVAMRLTKAPRYDTKLQEWKKAYCSEHKLKNEDLDGYGDCPGDILYPYGCYDADVTRRIRMKLALKGGMLDKDAYGNDCWPAYHLHHRASAAFLEMEQTGFVVDRDRVDDLTREFMEGTTTLLTQLQEELQWPNFNPKSNLQCVAALFGDHYARKRDKSTGEFLRIRPEDAITLGLTPLTTTGKRPKLWTRVAAQGEEAFHTPSTNKEVLGILGHHNPIARKLRDFKFLAQVLQSTLRRPSVNDDTNEYSVNDDGNFEYDKGIAGLMHCDGRIRTHLSQVLETARAASRRPNLQNLCFDPLTEILTRRGWVRLPELTDDDLVAEYWADSQLIEFVPPSQRQTFAVAGNMVHICGVQIDLLLTENHRCLLKRRKTGELLEVAAANFPEPSGDLLHMHAGMYLGGSSQSLPPMTARWLCAVQADGHYVNGFDGQGISFGFSKDRKKHRLREILGDAHYTERHNGDVTTFYIGVEHNRELVTIAKQYLGSEKSFGSWLLDFDRATLDVFAEEFVLWDGLFARGTEFSSSQEANADWVQILWTLSGIRARKRVYRPENPNARLHHCVDIPAPRTRRATTSLVRTTASPVPYNGPVYCVTVPSGWVVVRRNGKVSVSGNSKRREDDYKRILGKDVHKHPVRSMLRVPEGMVGIECDLVGAELAVLAWLAQCPSMIDHVRRSMLPESHPDHYDIHSQQAVRAFNLQGVVPTKSGMKAAGVPGLRVAAKNVNFGIPYGRSAEAISRQCAEEGVDVTEEDCQRMIDAYFAQYPETAIFLQECRDRSQLQHWLRGAYGSLRRFVSTNDRGVIGEQHRQAQNFPIQNGVADAVSVALANLTDYRKKHLNPNEGCWYWLVLQIHDAVITQCEAKYAKQVCDIMFECMVRDVPFWPRRLDGTLIEVDEPYRFGIDHEVFIHWGEAITDEEAAQYELPLELIRH